MKKKKKKDTKRKENYKGQQQLKHTSG